MQVLSLRTCFVVAAALVASAHARAQCADWADRFAIDGVSQLAEFFFVFDDGSGAALFTGGDFAEAGGVAATNLARWDGASWSSLGTFTGSYGVGDGRTVYAGLVFDDGSGPALYVGGRFTSAGGVAGTSNIARWDGTTWSALGTGTDGAVWSLAVFDEGSGPHLFASGGFLNAGGVGAAGIARWDGSSWSPLGAGTSTDPIIKFRSLATYDDGSGPALYAGGHVYNYNSVNYTLTYLLRWNGSSWSTVGSGVDGVVEVLSVQDDGSGPALFVGGFFGNAGGVPAALVAKYDGAWHALGGGVDASVQAFATFDDGSGPALYVGGTFEQAGGLDSPGLAKWDGSAWSAVGVGGAANVHALQVFDDGSGTQLFVGGKFKMAGSLAVNNVAKYDGAQWSPIGGGDGFDYPLSIVAAAQAGNDVSLYAAGSFTHAGSTPANLLVRWNGTAWEGFGDIVGSSVDGIDSYDDGSGPALYVSGNVISIGGVSGRIAKWDGSSWSPLGSGLTGSGGAIAFQGFDDGSGMKLYVGGAFTHAGGMPANRVASWDGSTWAALGVGMNGVVNDLVVFDYGSGPALYAGGVFFTAGGASARHVARWDGATWSPLGAGLNNGFVNQLAVFDDGSGLALYAAGSFTDSGGTPMQGIARWDGVSWSSVGGSVTAPAGGAVFALEVFDDGTGGGPELHASGAFTEIGGVPANHVAKWNGTTWTPLGAGFDGVAYDATAFDFDADGDDDLVLGGEIETAGGFLSHHIAVWNGCEAPLGTPYCFGDGSGTACPCGNASASGAQQGCAHSAGYGAHLGAQGSTSIATDNQVLTVSSMPALKSCVLFVGNNALNGGNGVLFGDGLRCAGPSVHRLGVRTSDALGVASWGPSFSALNYWSAGDTRYFQVWFRDPTGPCAHATNLSSALSILFTN